MSEKRWEKSKKNYVGFAADGGRFAHYVRDRGSLAHFVRDDRPRTPDSVRLSRGKADGDTPRAFFEQRSVIRYRAGPLRFPPHPRSARRGPRRGGTRRSLPLGKKGKEGFYYRMYRSG